VKRYEREQILERIEREGATVGAPLPDEIDLDGEPFPLRAFVFEVKSMDGADSEEVAAAKKRLRRARLARTERIEDGAIDRAEAETLAEEVVAIDRALNALESLGPTDLEAEIQSKEVADRRRWRSFLQRALGREDR
jgi:hypothetical protein